MSGVEKTESFQAPMVLRPLGWKVTSDEAFAWLSSLRSPGVVFRGMTSDEYKATVALNGRVMSNRSFSHSSEGTSFSEDPGDAESYVNFGRDDPRSTGKPTYLVMVARSSSMYKDRDGYIKSKEPVPVLKSWMMYPQDGAVLVQRLHGQHTHESVSSWAQRLTAFLNSDEAWALLGNELTSWMQGGCWFLAEAIRLYLGPDKAQLAVVTSQGAATHVVVAYRGQFIDAEGVQSEAQLLRRMREEERVAFPRIERFRADMPNLRAGDRDGIPCPSSRNIQTLANLLLQRLGPPALLEHDMSINEGKKDIGLPNLSDLSKEQIDRAYAGLSAVERAQLGKPVGKSAYVSDVDWPRQRAYMLQKSLHSNPHTDPELTAYTPGETTNLLKHPKIVEWHNKMASFVVPPEFNTVVFVPCAKSKPWVGPACAASLYSHYNELRKKFGNIYFVTISEPLGVVPQDRWGDFPQYDNPGLFKDPVLRSDMFTADWQRLYPGTTSRLQTPFDPSEYNKAIDVLANVIKAFISTNKRANPKLRFLSFVEEPEGRPAGTHSDMMTRAGFDGSRYEKAQKRGASKGREPMDYLMSTLKAAGVVALKENEQMNQTFNTQIYDNKPKQLSELLMLVNNPTTPARVLALTFERYGLFMDGAAPDYFQLTVGEREILRRQIALNGNTPVDVLLQIAIYQPLDAVKNPNIINHLMDNPALAMQFRDRLRVNPEHLQLFNDMLDRLLGQPVIPADEPVVPVEEALPPPGGDAVYKANMANLMNWQIRAADPQTPPEVLMDIYVQASKAKINLGKLMRMLALNPNSPAGLLVKLVQEFPEAVATNPALSMISLEDPRLLGLLMTRGGPRFKAAFAQNVRVEATTLSPAQQVERSLQRKTLVLSEAQHALFQKARRLDEAPITGFDLLGDFTQNSSFHREADRRLISNPKVISQVKHKWENTKWNFQLYFVNRPAVNHEEFRERGETDLQTIRWAMKIDLADFPGPRADAITIFYTNNRGAEWVPMTAWMMAHRMSHAFRMGNGQTAKLWREFADSVEKTFQQVLRNAYSHQFKTAGYSAYDANQKTLELAAQVLGTMRSARNKDLRNWGEFTHELLAQYLLTGTIKFNPLPQRMPYAQGAFGRMQYHSTDDTVMLNQEDLRLESAANQFQAALERVFQSAVGKMFVM